MSRNAFTIPEVDHQLDIRDQDRIDNKNMMDILEDIIIPMYYNEPKQWVEIMKNAMSEIEIEFNSGRMAHQYYEFMFDYNK